MSHRSHAGHQHSAAAAGDRRVLWAVVVNIALTLAQVAGGVIAGSLSLAADAMHNFSDAASLGIAFAARRIARRPSDHRMTFGYVRAEIVAALINYTTLIVIGLYLVYEAVLRLVEPPEVQGWLVVAVAGIALTVDAVTALLTYAPAKTSINIRAAFMHNVADALGSIGVIVAGTLILLYDWRIVDPLVTLAIAGYVLWQALAQIGDAIRILMLGTPAHVNVDALLDAVRAVDGIEDIHHLHVWSIDEHDCSLEAHIVLREGQDAEAVKQKIRALARERFGITHATLETESARTAREHSADPVGHGVARAAPDAPRR